LDDWRVSRGRSRYRASRFARPRGEFSHYTLSGSFAPGATATRPEEVPEPPHDRTLKFSKIDCTLDRVVFADGSAWP
jgi:hypothetical protein